MFEMKRPTTENDAWEVWSELVARTRVDGAIPVKFKVDRNWEGIIGISISGSVPAVRDIPATPHFVHDEPGYPRVKAGTLISVNGFFQVPHDLHRHGERDMLLWLRNKTRTLYEHELNEQFTVTSKFGEDLRPFDPHVADMIKLAL